MTKHPSADLQLLYMLIQLTVKPASMLPKHQAPTRQSDARDAQDDLLA